MNSVKPLLLSLNSVNKFISFNGITNYNNKALLFEEFDVIYQVINIGRLVHFIERMSQSIPFTFPMQYAPYFNQSI